MFVLNLLDRQKLIAVDFGEESDIAVTKTMVQADVHTPDPSVGLACIPLLPLR